MDRKKPKSRLLVSTITVIAALFVAVSSFAAEANREMVTPAFKEAITTVPGKTMTALVVTYPPGAKTPPHYHDSAFVVGYVLSGAIRSQVDNGPARIYQAGEHWTESPGAHHVVSENASKTKPAKLLAILIADTGEKNLVSFKK